MTRTSKAWLAGLAAAFVLAIPLLWPLAPDDTNQDWVLLRAAQEGLDISLPVVDLALALGLEGVHSTYPVARPPGFFTVYFPTWPDPAIAEAAIIVLNAVAIAVLIHVTQQMTGAGPLAMIAVTLGCLVLTFGMVRYNNPTLVWAALIAFTWKHMDGHVWWGVPLGIAAAVRLWPALPILWLLTRRRQTGYGAALTAATLTLAGLLIVPYQTAIASLLAGQVWAEHHPFNFSLTWLLAGLGISVFVTLIVGSALTLWVARKDSRLSFGYVLTAAMFLSPITWPAYLAATAPMWPMLGRKQKKAPVSAPEGVETGDSVA